jgi:carboxylesterase type B
LVFFAHPALTAEGKGGPLGNYAFMDTIAAMKWGEEQRGRVRRRPGERDRVRRIGRRHGDAHAADLARGQGLVHKAIIESGGGRNGIFPARKVHEDTPNGPTSAESVGVAFAKSVGIEGTDAAALAALRKVPADQVIAGLNLASMERPAAATYAGGPMIDGQIMVETAEDAYRAGHNAKVPLIVGANSLDIGFLVREEHGRGDGEVRRQQGQGARGVRSRQVWRSALGRLQGGDGRDDGRARAVPREDLLRHRASPRISIASRTWPSHCARRRPALRTPPRSRSCSIR